MRKRPHKLKTKSFVIDGEAVWLDENGLSHFNRLHSRKHFGRFIASTYWWSTVMISAINRYTPARRGWNVLVYCADWSLPGSSFSSSVGGE